MMKKRLRAAAALFCLAAILFFNIPVWAAPIPDGVTRQTAETACVRTDVLVENALRALSDTSLRTLVMDRLTADETMSTQ